MLEQDFLHRFPHSQTFQTTVPYTPKWQGSLLNELHQDEKNIGDITGRGTFLKVLFMSFCIIAILNIL